MNIQNIIKYYLRDVPPKHYAYQVTADVDDNQSLEFFFCADSYNLNEPTQLQMLAMEEQANEWVGTVTSISYYEFWELLSFPLQVAVSNRAEELRSMSPPDTGLKTLIGKTYDPSNYIDLSDAAVVGEGGYFDIFLTDLVLSGVLTNQQAENWQNLEEVS